MSSPLACVRAQSSLQFQVFSSFCSVPYVFFYSVGKRKQRINERHSACKLFEEGYPEAFSLFFFRIEAEISFLF